MKKHSVQLTVDDDLAIRTIASRDLEDLRSWKNEHRQYFFYKDVIDATAQQKWHAGYHSRAEDFMFVVEWRGQPIGCMGIRWLGTEWDVYNVILGRREFAGQGRMGRALQRMLAFAKARHAGPVGLKVLTNNPAVRWYEKNGFSKTVDGGDHLVMALTS